MSDIQIDTAQRVLRHDTTSMPCIVGRNGAIAAEAKREGDGATPLGRWPIRGALLRPDHMVMPQHLSLPWRWLRLDDGWSDDPADPAYNRPVTHAHGFSAERLWREDGAYDAIIILGYNDAPPVAGLGSAIFLHCTVPQREFTEGCVAVAKESLIALLTQLGPGDAITIV